MRPIVKFVVFLCLTSLVFSCKKSSDAGSSYYLKAKFDGTEKTFNTQVIAFKVKLSDNAYNLSITGLNGTSEEGVISLNSEADDFVAGKTYTIDAGYTYNIFGYTAPLGTSEAANIWTSTYDYGVVDQSFSCTITEITSAYVKGTFSTVIYQGVETDPGSKTITEGQFYAKF